jgi:hypothetical protein
MLTATLDHGLFSWSAFFFINFELLVSFQLCRSILVGVDSTQMILLFCVISASSLQYSYGGGIFSPNN